MLIHATRRRSRRRTPRPFSLAGPEASARERQDLSVRMVPVAAQTIAAAIPDQDRKVCGESAERERWWDGVIPVSKKGRERFSDYTR
jgi:hypothetical protein